jgi:hypothetical protein
MSQLGEGVVVPTIRIDDEVFGKLQSMAEPFVDTPNTVLRRLLGIADVHSRRSAGGQAHSVTVSKPRARPGSILPHEAYVRPILRTLAEAGGSASTTSVIDAVGQELGDRLTDLDRDRLTSGNIRWQNRVQWVRLRLVERGMIEARSPRGVWTITAAGRRFLDSNDTAFS